MTLLSSLSSATSGLTAASTDLSVISDNIANAQTIGFKESRAVFEDALAQNMAAGSGQQGLGTRLQSIQKLMVQGSLVNTGNPTDLALQGNGFFELKGTSRDGRHGTFLSRNGAFTTDKNGFLVSGDGLRVQGYIADADGKMTTNVDDLQVTQASSLPNPTGEISMTANLDSRAEILDPFDPADPASTSNFSTSATIYDSLGKDYQATIYFRKTAAGAWEFHAMMDGGNVNGGVEGTAFEIGSGTMNFDVDGTLVSSTQTSNFNPIDADQPQDLTFNFGTGTNEGGEGLDGITQFAATSVATSVAQDGYNSGQLSSITIDKSGVIEGVFTNGKTRALGQVAVAQVSAPDQLERLGGNLYCLSTKSGDLTLGIAGEGGRALVSSGTLEQSNVDIADQFVKMITAQRGYEANAKSITTADSLLSELIQMKR